MESSLFLAYHASSDAEAATLYDRMLDLAIVGDRAGCEYIWTPEHHLIRFLASPSALIAATQIGQHVKCRVGTAVVVLPYHNPVQLAGEVAATDQAVGGRFQLGVARGAYKYEFEVFGLDFDRSKDQFVETLESIELLLTNGDSNSSYNGDIVQFKDAYVWPRPKAPGGPPIWIGAQSPPSITDAASRGYNVMHSGFLWGEDHIRGVAEAFNLGLSRLDQDLNKEPKLMINRYAALGRSEEEVQDLLNALLVHWRVHKQLHDFSHGPDNERGVIEPKPQDNEPSLDEIRQNVMIGTATELKEKIGFYASVGVDVLSINPAFGISHDVSKRTIEFITEEIALAT